MKRFVFVSLALAGVMVATPSTHATPLAIGGTSSSIATTTLGTLGTLLQTFGPMPLALNPPGGGVTQSIFGTYQESVYQMANGNLSFVEQVSLASNSVAVDRITASAYGSFTTDVFFVSGTGTPPNNTGTGAVIDRSSEGGGTTGNTVGFNFNMTPIGPGMSAATLVIETNAKNFDSLGTLGVIDSTTSSNLTFEPALGVLAVPEPSTMALTGLGALGMIGYGLRRRKAPGA